MYTTSSSVFFVKYLHFISSSYILVGGPDSNWQGIQNKFSRRPQSIHPPNLGVNSNVLPLILFKAHGLYGMALAKGQYSSVWSQNISLARFHQSGNFTTIYLAIAGLLEVVHPLFESKIPDTIYTPCR